MLWSVPGARCISVILAAALMSVSCTSIRLVRPSDIEGSLKQGDTVKILTKDGRDLELKIVTIAPEAIVGTPISSVGTAEAAEAKERRVEFTDIERIEKREINAAKTAGLVAGIVAVVAVVLLMVAAVAAAGQAALASQI